MDIVLNKHIELAEIDVGQDAQLGVEWLNAPFGIETLRLLGNILPDNFKTDLATERARISKLIKDKNILAWAIKYNGQAIGIVEIKLKEFEAVKPPSITIIIGDINMRGKGIGQRAVKLALKELKNRGYKITYARALINNLASQNMLTKIGFVPDGQPYIDKDGLYWKPYKITI